MKWFRHMSNASDDEFLAEVEEIFGLEGYARWWKLLEAIAEQMDGTSKCGVSYSWTKWQAILKGKRNKLETFLKHCQNKQKIILEENGNILKITCRNLLKMRDEYSRKSGQAPDGSPDNVAPEEDTEVEVSTGTNVPSTATAAPLVNHPPEIDFKKIIFSDGLKWLEQKTGKPPDKLRPLVGSWCKHGDDRLAAAIIKAQKDSAVDPIAYITKILGGGNAKSTGQHTGFDEIDYESGAREFNGG